LIQAPAVDTIVPYSVLLAKIENGTARIAILGLGYVGLPLALEFAKHFPTIGLDVDAVRVAELQSGRSYIGDISAEELASPIRSKMFSASSDFDTLAACDCAIICVPTPLEDGKQPDLSYVLGATQTIVELMVPGGLIVLESTTLPGTTDDMLFPMFATAGKAIDEDFFLAFSPERIDPGNCDYRIADIPKIVGGCSSGSTKLAAALYERIVPHVHCVSSARVAETAKLWENTFRSVNIALANELSMMCDGLGIDTHEVIDAAATKPFGFMPFYPGPGVGGHCIPLDPQYLSWSTSRYGYTPRFIALADQINTEMSDYIVNLTIDSLNDDGKALRGARILVLGVTYKADIADVRISPAIPIIERLRARRARVRYHDPFVPRLLVDERELPPSPRRDLRGNPAERRASVTEALAAAISQGRRRTDPLESRELTDEELRHADCVLVITAHTSIDYARVSRQACLVVDSRGVVPRTWEHGAARVVTL
jgi:UDP-N-acetyl-D-glucosamine dehydrogenase